jgi:MoaA/NifB/PqqE/SkfB family radical SAM enzyme
MVSPTELVLFPSSGCNLKCKHCSYLCKSSPEQNIPIKKLKETINDAIKSGIKLVVLVGREPLLEFNRTKEILDFLKDKNVKVGMVTNGTLVSKHIRDLKKYNFYYIDVSLDGPEKEHEINRGKGSFGKAKEGIKLILNNCNYKKFFLSSTLMAYNYKALPKMVIEFTTYGVENFCFGTYIYTGENSKEWKLETSQLLEFIDSLKKLKVKGQLILDVHSKVQHLWDFLIEEEIILQKDVKFDENHNCYYKIPETNIFLKNSRYTTGPAHTAIITADGYYLPDYELIASREYKEKSLGNVNNMSYRKYLEKIKTASSKTPVYVTL